MRASVHDAKLWCGVKMSLLAMIAASSMTFGAEGVMRAGKRGWVLLSRSLLPAPLDGALSLLSGPNEDVEAGRGTMFVCGSTGSVLPFAIVLACSRRHVSDQSMCGARQAWADQGEADDESEREVELRPSYVPEEVRHAVPAAVRTSHYISNENVPRCACAHDLMLNMSTLKKTAKSNGRPSVGISKSTTARKSRVGRHSANRIRKGASTAAISSEPRRDTC